MVIIKVILVINRYRPIENLHFDHVLHDGVYVLFAVLLVVGRMYLLVLDGLVG